MLRRPTYRPSRTIAILIVAIQLILGGIHPATATNQSDTLSAKETRTLEKAKAKARKQEIKRKMRQDLTHDQRKQLNERVKEMDGLAVGQHIRISGGAKGAFLDPIQDSILRRGRYIRTTLRPDSTLIAQAGFDSIPLYRDAPDTIIAQRFSDSLLITHYPDSVLWHTPFRIAGLTYPEADTTHTGGRLSAADSALLFKPRFRITQDTIAAGKHTILSLVAPGFGQIYNRQAWKLPILYGGVGGFLTGGILFHNKYKTYKAEYQRTVDLRLPPDIQKRARTRMRNAGSGQTLMYAMAGATYLYFVADAVFNYRGPVDPVRKATTLAAVFPGMGFVYTKTYWRLPIYYGGFIALATVVDYNNRNYQRYKAAYDAMTDGNPSTIDEFNGRYSPELLSRVRSAYRRDRDLAIIGMAAAYLLSVVDTYVIASLKNWDVDENLSVRIEPTQIDTRFNGRTLSPSQGNSYGLAVRLRF
ncbi:DUF5683 domain-containing protein [uncultured Rikenella sp.]|uniref:DUF5683 domain-containing protein n=1 Tax=uncultured Rikenella sp. TaxID=368003 RepID=UPI0026342B95|nr:DUF5683 domain-containing protein [uncultured Rikenella sp.]